MILSVDPGRVNPGISLWDPSGKLKGTFTPSFKAKSAEARLEKIYCFNYNEGFFEGVTDVIIETNTIAAGKEVGCMIAGMYTQIGASVHFVSPIHVATWASKFFNTPLCNIPRTLKKRRTKELMEIITGRENLTFDESDSILNYFYWFNVKRDLRH